MASPKKLNITANGEEPAARVPLVLDEMSFQDLQKGRLKEIEKRMEAELRKKKREWEKEVERMKEEFQKEIALFRPQRRPGDKEMKKPEMRGKEQSRSENGSRRRPTRAGRRRWRRSPSSSRNATTARSAESGRGR